MRVDEYIAYDALGLAELIRAGDVTAHEVGEVALAALGAVEAELNCTVEVYGSRVEALRDAPVPRGAFGGVPFLIKDLGEHEAGHLCENGSLLTQGYRATEDAVSTTRFRRAGLVTIGRSAVPEWAWSITCRTPINGLTANPWDTARCPGGSSSGAAAAVAAGVVPVAGGSDAGGSIRGPASYCGLVGLKVSRGRVSDSPWVDPVNHMAVPGVLTRTVRDTACAIDVLAGPEPGDLSFAPPLQRPLLDEVGRPTGRLRVAVSTVPPGGGVVEPEVIAATVRVAELLASDGHEVAHDEPAVSGDAMLVALHTVWSAFLTSCIDGYAAELGVVPGPDNLMRTTWATYLDGRRSSATDLLAAHDEHNTIRRATAHFLDRYDIWLTPSSTMPAPPHDLCDQDHPGFDDDAIGWTRHMFATEMFLPVHNITGSPAISLPLGWSSAGLPVGVQIAARFGDDAMLIRVAAMLEEALPWHDRRPTVHASYARQP